MLLWLAIIVLTAVAVAVVAKPLLSPQNTPDHAETADAGAGIRAVYKDQLLEIDADFARGLIGADEAAAARLELSRRLLSQAATDATNPAVVAHVVPPETRAAILVSIPILALGLYAGLGAPTQPGRPTAAAPVLAGRGPASGATDIDELIAKVEARLRANPEDGRGWDVIAPVYLKSQRFAEAQAAFARAISLLGETPKRLAGFAESAVRAAGGQVTEPARAAFGKVVTMEPGNLEARLWLAIAHEQRGSFKEAADDYRAILADAPPAASWRGVIAERLVAATAAAGDRSVPALGAPAKGPTAADVAAAKDLAPEARQQMISGMVANLHARLKSDGRDASGWQRLLRAYGVLGDLPKANAALTEARQALTGDAVALSAIDALALELGLGS